MLVDASGSGMPAVMLDELVGRRILQEAVADSARATVEHVLPLRRIEPSTTAAIALDAP